MHHFTFLTFNMKHHRMCVMNTMFECRAWTGRPKNALPAEDNTRMYFRRPWWEFLFAKEKFPVAKVLKETESLVWQPISPHGDWVARPAPIERRSFLFANFLLERFQKKMANAQFLKLEIPLSFPRGNISSEAKGEFYSKLLLIFNKIIPCHISMRCEWQDT